MRFAVSIHIDKCTDPRSFVLSVDVEEYFCQEESIRQDVLREVELTMKRSTARALTEVAKRLPGGKRE